MLPNTYNFDDVVHEGKLVITTHGGIGVFFHGGTQEFPFILDTKLVSLDSSFDQRRIFVQKEINGHKLIATIPVAVWITFDSALNAMVEQNGRSCCES